MDSEDSEDELIKINKLRDPIITEVASEMNVLEGDASSVFSSDFNIGETNNDNSNNNNNNKNYFSAESDEPVARKKWKYATFSSDESDGNNNNSNNNIKKKKKYIKNKYKHKNQRHSSESVSEGHQNDNCIHNNNNNKRNKKKQNKTKKNIDKNKPWSKSKLPHNGKITFRGKVNADRFKLANKANKNKRNNCNNNNNSNNYAGHNREIKTQQIKNIKNENKKKRETQKKNSTKAGLGDKLSFAVIFGHGWRYKYLIFFAQWVRDGKSTKNPTYYIKPIDKINSYKCRDILMHTIKRNKKLKTRRFSFDGASTHSSGGSVNKKTGIKTCHMINYLTNNKIKTFGFAGENVTNRYQSQVGWGAHSMDLQAAEKCFNITKANGSFYVSCLEKKYRTMENVMKCYQRAYEEIPQAHMDNWIQHTWNNREACLKAKGDFGDKFMRRN